MRDEVETLCSAPGAHTNNFHTRYALYGCLVPFMGERADGCSKGRGEILAVEEGWKKRGKGREEIISDSKFNIPPMRGVISSPQASRLRPGFPSFSR
jgi:hypothetical protein